MEQFYRPTAASTTRAKKPQQEVASAARRQTADDGAEEDAFLRARRRVPVRRGLIPTSRWGRIAAAAGLSLSPDGHYLLYSQYDRSAAELLVVENFH